MKSTFRHKQKVLTKQEQFLQLYEPVHRSFERYCRSRSFGTDYRDLMNETLLVAFEKADKLENERAFFSFLCGIARNIVGNQLRKKKTVSLTPDDLKNFHGSIQNEEQLDIQILYKALALLPDEQEEALVLFEISGFSIREIAEIQQAGESAVKQRLKRGRERLAELLHENEVTNQVTLKSTEYEKK